MSRDNAYRAYTAGFGPYMVPVTAPGEAHVSGIEDKDMGKCPGLKNKMGDWYPQSVRTSYCASAEEARQWDDMNANVGLALGRDAKHIAIDNDIDDHIAARAVNAILQRHFKIWRGVDDPNHVRLLFPFRVKGVAPKGTTLVFEKDGVHAKIDILSDGKQFVAFGTHPRTGKPYTWSVDPLDFMDGVFEFPEITFEQLQEILAEIAAALEAIGWVKASGAVSDNSGTAGTNTQERKTCTEYELTRWLALIPNGDNDDQFTERDKWVGMAHAIHGASEGADWGRELWLNWCNQRSQTPGEPEKVWDTLKGSEGRVGLDYIREKARERNARLAAQLDFELAPPVDEAEIEALAAGVRQGSLWELILPRYVWVAGLDKFCDLVTGQLFTKQGIDGKLGHLAETLQSEAFQTIPVRQRRLLFSQMFSMHPDTIKVDNMTYWPGQARLAQDETGRMLVNSWRAPSFKHVKHVSENDIQPWLDLVKLVIGTKNDWKLFIKFLALIVKYPGIKPNFAPVVLSQPGLGKDTMLIPVLVGVGQGNYFMVGADNLVSTFTPYLEKRFIYMSEMRQHQRGSKSSHDVMNDLKAYLADKPEWVATNRKGIGEYLVRNLTGWVFFSNEKRPIFVAEGDRRMWIIDNMEQPKESADYYTKLNKWLEKNAHLVASYLRDYPLTVADIEIFKGAAPDTTAKSLLIEANRDPVEVALRELIEEVRQGSVFNSCIVTSADIVAELKNRVPYVPGGQIICGHLHSLGARPVVPASKGAGPGPVKLIDGKTARLWVLADTDASGRDYSALSVAEAKQVYLTAKWPAPNYQTQTGVPLTAINGGDEI